MHFKNYEKWFLFPLKAPFALEMLNIFLVFSVPFHSFQIQRVRPKNEFI